MSDNASAQPGVFYSAAKVLSERATSLWAKLPAAKDNSQWLPLFIHLSDAAGVAAKLWASWLSDASKRTVTEGFHCCSRTDKVSCEAGALAVFLAASHDLGKATPAFQIKALMHHGTALSCGLIDKQIELGLKIRKDLANPNEIYHATASELILERNGIGRSLAVIAGGHHGVPPSKGMVRELKISSLPDNTGFSNPAWIGVQNELTEYSIQLAGFSKGELEGAVLSVEAQVILSGLVIMSDWIASNEDLFPYDMYSAGTAEEYRQRLERAFGLLDLPSCWMPSSDWETADFFARRFGFIPRPFQQAVVRVAATVASPGIMVIEAPMGEGKTEAALAAAEIFAQRFGLSGVMFALPTQATSDGIFPRIEKWMGCVSTDTHTVFLAHGKSRYNRFYEELPRTGWNVENENGSNGGVVVNQWFSGRKKGLLSDFVVGTVDQVLMGGLKQKHLALRHLGLTNKVVIIDECHAYDEYMGSYLNKILQWLGAYRVPVILMSATLPPARRQSLIEAYAGKPVISGAEEWRCGRGYPALTYLDGNAVKQTVADRSGRSQTVSIQYLTDGDLIPKLTVLTGDGGYVGIIVNTVKRAQQIAQQLRESIGGSRVYLLHSGFTSIDRTGREAEVLELLNTRNRQPPPFRMFVVGTQVIEQSLDLDFDLLVSDLCPVDLLIQRIGRLHRHENLRAPSLQVPRCLILDRDDGRFEPGAEAVYGRYQLMNARILLPEVLQVPADIPEMVSKAYGADGVAVPVEQTVAYGEAKKEMQEKMVQKEKKAQAFQIRSPSGTSDLIGWLDYAVPDDLSDEKAEATVRDTDGSVEVILVRLDHDKTFRILPWIGDGGNTIIPSDAVPPSRLAFTIAGCRIPLPRRMIAGGRMDGVLKELARLRMSVIPKVWQDSEWLAEENILPLNEKNAIVLQGMRLVYDQEQGMRIEDERYRIQFAR